jgi:hypothetical protein
MGRMSSRERVVWWTAGSVGAALGLLWSLALTPLAVRIGICSLLVVASVLWRSLEKTRPSEGAPSAPAGSDPAAPSSPSSRG